MYLYIISLATNKRMKANEPNVTKEIEHEIEDSVILVKFNYNLTVIFLDEFSHVTISFYFFQDTWEQ